MPSSSAPPTLEQLRALLSAVRQASCTRDESLGRTTFSLTVDGETLAELGVTFYADAGTLVSSLLEAIERLCYIDTTLGDYTNVDRKGTTAADCQAFIANELKNVPPTHDLQSNIQRRMFNATLQKLVELGVWRAAVDAQRFQNQREAERKRQANQKKASEDYAKAKAEAERRAEQWKQQQEYARRQEERRERDFRAGKAPPPGWGSPGKGPSFEDIFREAHDSHRSSFYDSAFREAFRDYKAGFDQDPFGFGNSRPHFEDTFSNRQQEPPKGPKARNKDRAHWAEVLGVPINADKATIKSAYRKLASKYHPDRNKEPDAVQRMKDINTAKDEGLKGALA